jgi:hypothetical protein
MICKQCEKDNGFAKKCCSSCGAFLEGWTINNVTGKFGYRDKDGGFFTIDAGADIERTADILYDIIKHEKQKGGTP